MLLQRQGVPVAEIERRRVEVEHRRAEMESPPEDAGPRNRVLVHDVLKMQRAFDRIETPDDTLDRVRNHEPEARSVEPGPRPEDAVVRIDASGFTLSEDQEQARRSILQGLESGQCELVLTGPAGSGKTTMLRVLIKDLEDTGRKVRLVAPTGKAATRLSQLAGRPATTVHKPLYLKVEEDNEGKVHFGLPQPVAAGNTVILLDEASMLSRAVHADLMSKLPPEVQVVFVGDREQLPPVNDTWGADFANPTAVLTQIHRQALLSPILSLATEIRNGRHWRNSVHDHLHIVKGFDVGVSHVLPEQGRVTRVRHANLEHAAHWLVQTQAAGYPDTVLLTYTNKSRQLLNSLVRSLHGRLDQIEPGDRIVCKRNNPNLFVCNGEVRSVDTVEYLDTSHAAVIEFDDGVQAILFPHLLSEQNGGDKVGFARSVAMLDTLGREQVMRAEYGECLTIHASQGSQFDRVGLVLDFDWMGRKDAETYRRLLYTAVTRACQELVIFEV